MGQVLFRFVGLRALTRSASSSTATGRSWTRSRSRARRGGGRSRRTATRSRDADLASVVGRPYTFTHAYLAERVAAARTADALWPELRDGAVRADRHAPASRSPTRLQAVADLRVRGVALAVASSSVRERLDRTLARAGLDVRRQRRRRRGRARQARAGHVPARRRAPRGRIRRAASSSRTRRRASPRAARRACRRSASAACPGTEATLAAADRIVDIVSADEILALL